MGMGDMFSTIDMFSSIDQWLSTINKNMSGQVKPGFRAKRTSFGGAMGTYGAPRTTGLRPSNRSQASLNATEELDMTQGLIKPTGKDTDYAIRGDGFFVLEDSKGKLYYSRFGEFTPDSSGRMNTPDGLQVVTRSRLIEKGIIQPTLLSMATPQNIANTRYLLNRGMAGWQPSEATALGAWFPHYNVTAYEENNGTYQQQTIAMTRTYDLGSNPSITTANSFLRLASDDWTHLTVNGHTLGIGDVTSFGNPGLGPLPHTTTLNHGGPTSGALNGEFNVFNVAKFLKPGLNHITAYSSEVRDFEGISIAGQMAGVAVQTAGQENQWLSRIIGQNEKGSDEVSAEPFPSGERYDRAFERGIDDLAIASFINPGKMKYSRYGSHIMEPDTNSGAVSYDFSAKNDATAKIRRGFLEAANTDMKRETQELAMAQRMYDAVTSLMQMQIKAVEAQLNIIK